MLCNVLSVTGHSKFCNVTKTILKPEFCSFSNSSRRLFVLVTNHLVTLKEWNA